MTPGATARANLTIRCCALLLIGWFAVSVTSDCRAQWIEPSDLVSPLVDGEPFDLIKLNADGGNALIKIIPQLEPPGKPLPGTGTLIFEYADSSEDLLQVPYSSVEYYKTFNELLIEEANAWLEGSEYPKAFRNLLYVYDHGGKNDSKLVQSLRSCLFLDGADNFKEGRFELALSIYEDIYRRDPKFVVAGFNSTLIDIIMRCYDGMIQKQFDAADFANVQRKLESVREKYGDLAAALSEKWSAAFLAKGDELMQQSRQFASQGKGREAHLASRQAEQMTPGREEVKKLQEEILRQFPLIVVGVSQSGAGGDPRRIEHWGSRRTGRLNQRTLVELTGLSDEGGKYHFLNGDLYRADEFGLKYIFELEPDATGFGVPPTSAFEVSTRLLATANPKSPEFDIALGKIIDTISIEGENQVAVTLNTPYVRPEALMNITYQSAASECAAVQNGKYVQTQIQDELTTFELNPNYQPVEGRQHPVIIEQLYRSASEAVDELIKGNIDVVDRIPPADLKRAKQTRGIVVRPYVLPTVHMLIPKIRGDLKDDLNFRNGLSTAINRQMLVEDVICDGQVISGCEEISGPFPIGTEDNDQIAYGYDLKVRSLPFNEKLAMVLIELSLRPNHNRKEKIDAPSLVIAHPQSSSAKLGASAIARMWTDVGVATGTRELPPGESVPTDEQWDFLYLEITIEEPLSNAARIVGQTGFAKDVSATVEQTIRNLSYSQNWRATCESLRRLHRQVSVDLSVIPLWQITEHFAYRNTVRGIGRDLIHLYQNVERWQIDTYGTDEE